MIRVRRYWLEYTIVALAVFVLFIGIAHRTDRSISSIDDAIREAALPARAMANRLSGNTPFSVDTISSGGVLRTFGGIKPVAVSVRSGDTVVVTGWAVDGVALVPASAVMLQIDRNRKVDAQYGGSRPDVARAYGVPAYVGCAFTASVGTKQLSVGRHDVSLFIFDSKRTGFYEARNQIFLSVR